LVGDEVGAALRWIRISRGLTLRQAARRSEGRFPPTSIAGYERGERAITVERFVRLAEVYDIAPERLLAEIMRVRRGRPALLIDRRCLSTLDLPEAEVLDRFTGDVARVRGRPLRDRIAVRVGDVEVLATMCHRDADAFLDVVADAIVPVGDRVEASNAERVDERRARRDAHRVGEHGGGSEPSPN